jgi:protein-tyrosine kinase
MSKVYEALKRAQEERSSAPKQVKHEKPVLEIEASQAVIIPVPSSPIGLTGAPISTVAASAPPLPELLPQAPAAGRDPKTGQFLRFEDLLKSCVKPTWVLDPRTVVFNESNRPTAGSEQFRTLRTRLYNLRETAPLKKILVTSAVAGEGKTFVATNLAQAIAREPDRRVLLIDADLRSPALHLPLRAPLSPGMSEYLRNQATEAEIIQHGQEGKLCFIAAGTGEINASELLSNGSLEKLLDRLAPLFDWVIIDSPPCLPVADANVLAGMCDGVLLVVRAKSTPAAATERARKELQKRKVLGVVLNAVEEAQFQEHYYYHGYGQAVS